MAPYSSHCFYPVEFIQYSFSAHRVNISSFPFYPFVRVCFSRLLHTVQIFSRRFGAHIRPPHCCTYPSPPTYNRHANHQPPPPTPRTCTIHKLSNACDAIRAGGQRSRKAARFYFRWGKVRPRVGRQNSIDQRRSRRSFRFAKY
jgi:hypothetical protein